MSGTEGTGLSSCCLSGHLHTGTPKGREEEIAGLKCYISPPSDGSKSKTVLYLTDIFGWQFNNARLLADEYAKTGLYVVMPDLFNGGAIDISFLDTIEPNRVEREKLTAVDKAKNTATIATTFGPFVVKNREAVVRPRIDAVVDALKADPAVGKIGAVGFCFGGRYAVLLAHKDSKVDAVVSNHPAMLGFPADLEPVEKPLSVALGDEDSLVGKDQVDKIIDILEKKTGLPKEIVIYPEQVHGFTVRGDPTSDKDKKAMDDALKQAVNWFNKYLA